MTVTLLGYTQFTVDTPVTVEFRNRPNVNLNAVLGEDYSATTANVVIPAGEWRVTAIVTLTPVDDNIAEDDEVARLTARSTALTGTDGMGIFIGDNDPAPAEVVITATPEALHESDETLEISGDVPGLTVTGAEVTIWDDDAAPTSIGLSVTGDAVTEGGGAVSLTVEATLMGGRTRDEDTIVNVSLVDLTATATDDYTAAWGTTALTIPAGRSSAGTTLTFTPVQDTLYEGDETVAVRGENADPGLPVNGVRFTIVDDDPAPTTVRLSVTPGAVSEGALFELTDVTATLEGNSTLQEDLRINVRMVGRDSTRMITANSLARPLVIASGESSGTSSFIFTFPDDDVDDEDEIVEVRGRSGNPGLRMCRARWSSGTTTPRVCPSRQAP